MSSKTYFQKWTATYPTEFWHDSAEPAEIRRAATWGGTGVTTNPILMPLTARRSVLRWDVEIARWKHNSPPASVEEIAWALIRGIATEAAAIMAPVYHRTHGHTGLVCVQVDPTKDDDAEAMVRQGREITTWATNLLIKIPVTAAGLVAIEELAAHGVSTTATVSFSVPQVLQVAKAFRRGLARARRKGMDTCRLHSYAVIMIGRLDDHLRDQVAEGELELAEAAIQAAGEAVAKKAAALFRERGYESVLLFSSFRGYHDPGAVLGGPHVLTIPTSLEEQLAHNEAAPHAGMGDAVDQDLIEALKHAPDFARGYREDGMTPDEFAGYGPVVKTLNEFKKGYADLLAYVRERLAAL